MITLMYFDLGVHLYTPHREYFFSQLNNERECVLIKLKIDVFDNKSFKKAIDEYKPDFILIDPWILLPGKRDIAFKSANIILHPDLENVSSDIVKALDEIDSIKKIILGGWMDIHSLTKDDSQILETKVTESNYYLYSLGINSYNSNIKLDSENNKSRPATNYFSKLIDNKSFSTKIIPYLHAAPCNLKIFWRPEIQSYSNLEFKSHVPGSIGSYPTRKYILSKIQNENGELYVNILKLLTQIRVSSIKNKDLNMLNLSNYYYYDVIRKSGINFVDGGNMEYVTMKYLEVPGLGVATLSEDLISLKEYGIKPEEHYIPVSKNLEIPFLNSKIWNEKLTPQIIRLRNHIVSKHSLEIRVKQFISYLIILNDASANSNSYCAKFVNGDFIVE